MATKAEDILARLQALGYGTDTESSQLLTLNTVHKRVLNDRRWRFLTTLDKSKTVTAGDGTVAIGTLPTTKRLDAVRLESSDGERLLLEHQDEQRFRDWEHLYRDNGTPEYWTVAGAELHVWPLPSKTYTVVLDVVDNPVEITSKATEVQVPDSHADVLVWGTIMGVTFRERDWDGHNFSRQMYSELLVEMRGQFGMSDRQTVKSVQESGWYDQFDVESAWLI